MSRIGNRAIQIPEKVKVNIQGPKVLVEGPKGKLTLAIEHAAISCDVQEGVVALKRSSDAPRERALHGLYRSLINNMINGVTKGFRKDLQIEGVGFKAQPKGKGLVFDLGFSHVIDFTIPEGISVKVTTPTTLTVEGIDKQLVGQVAADIRHLKKPEPYQGKGIRYVGEVVHRKQGKKVG